MTAPSRGVRVAVEAIADRPERTFTYAWPPRLELPEPGSLLLVPYGRRLALGYLLAGEPDRPASTGGADAELREVEAVVSGPMLTPDLLVVAEEMAAYYRAPLGMVVAGMLPPGLESRLERDWRVLDPAALPAGSDAGERLGDRALRRLAPAGPVDRWLERLRRAGAIRAEWRLRSPELARRRVRTLRRAGEGGAPASAPRQRALLAALADGERTLPELAVELGVAAAELLEPARGLERRGLAALGWRELVRDPLAHRPRGDELRNRLAPEQRAALAAIDALEPGGELILEGVAASGKSDVYLAAIAAELAAGRGSLLLVPELSLVTQLADRVRGLFAEEVAVLHSGLSAGERHDEWWRLLRAEARVVVGTRMAVFAPLPTIGLIVVDEEHDGGYKQDRAPRYDARWVARRRATTVGARLVLGSATPDIVTLSRVAGGLADHARLRERRVGSAPRVDVVDLRAELAAGHRSIFSRPLLDAVARLVPGDEQAILLINRRGASTFVLCRDCGSALACVDCQLPLVHHLTDSRLRCHHCGRSAAAPSTCPACGSPRIRYFGAGTQRVEAELRRLAPGLRVGRLDSDAIARRRAFESVYDDFRDGRLDVLVGTQMAAKGLDLPAVTLAAVIAADVTLHLPDYRAAERTFQLLAQVAGRAGRGPRRGRVIIQTYAADHPAVRHAARLDLDAFAAEELPRRRLLGYPPYGLLARLLVADPDRSRAEERGRATVSAVAVDGVEALGPVPTYVPRRGGRWQFQVVIRAADEARRAAALDRVPGGVAIDVDPESLL